MNKHTTEAGKDLGTLVENVRDQALAHVKATDEAVRKYPYKAIGIALGIGALIGFFLARRSSDTEE